MSTEAGAGRVAGWQSYHLFYHSGLETPLRECVKPMVAELYGRGWLRQFFFVRYGLGGPHVRLRVLPAPGRAQQTGDFIWQEVADFFERRPSLHHKQTVTILRENKVLLANDAHETDDTVYPDNSLVESPFRPETERYGGPELLPHTLELFTVSSVAALSMLEAYAGQRRGLQMVTVARLLLKMASGFAESAEEFGALVGYGEEWGRESHPEIIMLADQLYGRQRGVMRRLVEDEVGDVSGDGGDGDAGALAKVWTLAAARFAHLVSPADAPTRRRIFTGHLHMTANRFGLKNTDEFYLSRLLARAFGELTAGGAAALGGRFGGRRRGAAGGALVSSSDLLRTAFGHLQAAEGRPGEQAEPSFSA